MVRGAKSEEAGVCMGGCGVDLAYALLASNVHFLTAQQDSLGRRDMERRTIVIMPSWMSRMVSLFVFDSLI